MVPERFPTRTDSYYLAFVFFWQQATWSPCSYLVVNCLLQPSHNLSFVHQSSHDLVKMWFDPVTNWSSPDKSFGMTIDSKKSVSKVNSRLKTVTSNDHRGSDGSFLPIIGHKLNGNNYLQYSQFVLMFISGKDKDGYLTGEIVQPKNDDPRFGT